MGRRIVVEAVVGERCLAAQWLDELGDEPEDVLSEPALIFIDHECAGGVGHHDTGQAIGDLVYISSERLDSFSAS